MHPAQILAYGIVPEVDLRRQLTNWRQQAEGLCPLAARLHATVDYNQIQLKDLAASSRKEAIFRRGSEMPIFEKPIDPADIDADNLAYDVMARLQKQRGVSVVSVVAGMNQSVAGMNQSIADARTEQVEHGWSVGLLGAMSHSVE